jgi:hypothetical protein
MSTNGKPVGDEPCETRATLSSLEPGGQALVTVETMNHVTNYCPDEAFDNLLVATVRQPSAIENVVLERGFDPQNVGVVQVNGSEFTYAGDMWASKRVNPSDLTGVSIGISQAARHLSANQGWFVFDNISTLLMYATEDRLFRLLSSVREQMANERVRGLYGIVPDAVSDRTYARFRSLFDREVVIR